MNKCQQKVYHHEPGSHSMSGWEEQCKMTAMSDFITIPDGIPVRLCSQHLKAANRRTALGMNTPKAFFVLAKKGA